MMEQLAERRMQREEDAQYAAAGLRHPTLPPVDGQAPPLDEGEYDDEIDEEYSDEEEEYEDEDLVRTSMLP